MFFYLKDSAYKNYGGRGIIICERWLDFDNFVKDMGFCGGDYSIERIDNNGNYEPSNCKWANAKEQARNRRNNVTATYNNETKCLAEWAEQYNLLYYIVRNRYMESNWTIDRVLETPYKPLKKKMLD